MPAMLNLPGYDANALKRQPDEGMIRYAIRRALGGPEAEMMGAVSPLAMAAKAPSATGALANLVRQLGGSFGDDMAKAVPNVTSRAVNASGESAASLESMRRMSGMKQAGRQAVRRRPSGAYEPFVGDPSDVTPNPGDQIGWLTNGIFERIR
jgi:hypothetical protein